MSHDTSNERLKAIQKAAKAHYKAIEAVMRGYETGTSGFELVRLGKEVERTNQAFLDLMATTTGKPPAKVKPPPLGEGLVPKR
jgi:hypothetical protein